MPSRLPRSGPREPCRGLAGRRDHVGAFADPPAAAVTAPGGWRTKFQMQRQCPLVGRENCPRRDGKGPGAATCDQRDNGHLETRYQAGGGAECREVHSRGDSCSYSHLKARRGKEPPTPSIVGRMRFLEGRGSEAALLSLSPGPLRWAVASRKRAPRRARGRRRGSLGPGRPGLPRAVSLGGNGRLEAQESSARPENARSRPRTSREDPQSPRTGCGAACVYYSPNSKPRRRVRTLLIRCKRQFAPSKSH